MNARLVRFCSITATYFVSTATLAQDAPPPASPEAKAPPASIAPSVARADLPEAKSILQKSIDAMGGEKAFDDIKSSMIKATMSTPMGGITLDMNWMKPNMVLIKQSMTGMESTMGSDGSVSWVKGPMGYQILEPEQAKQMQEQSNMFRMVTRMRDESKELKTVDQTKFGDFDCYKVSATDKDGTEQFAFFDSKEYLIRGIEAAQETPGGPVTSTIRFGDWKEDAGVKYFSKIDIDQMGMTMTLTFNEVKFNTLDASGFALPEEIKAMLKEKDAPATPPATTTAPATPEGGK